MSRLPPKVGLWVGVAGVVFVGGQLAVGMRATTVSPITADEPFYLLSTQSLLSDGDLDLVDEYEQQEHLRFWPAETELWVQMAPLSNGTLLSPHEPGLSVLLLPAYGVGGLEGAQRFLVAVWAAAMATAAVAAASVSTSVGAGAGAGGATATATARNGTGVEVGAGPGVEVVGLDERARVGARSAAVAAVVVGLGAPGVVYASQIYPEAPAALLAATAMLLLTGARPRALPMALLLVALMWFGTRYGALVLVLLAAFVWRHRRQRRSVVLLMAALIVGAVQFVMWHQDTFGGLTAYTTNIVWSGESDGLILSRHLQFPYRSHRLYASFLDVRFGLIRWFPAVVIALWGIGRRTAPTLALFLAALAMASFSSITIMGWWFPGRLLVAAFPALVVLMALGLPRMPRSVAAPLVVWSLAISVALVVAARTGSVRLAVDPWEIGAPLAPGRLFPDFRNWGLATVAVSALWGVGLAAARLRLVPLAPAPAAAPVPSLSQPVTGGT